MCGITPYIMIITSKKSMNYGVKSMAAKAMSWNQVCKQLSGIGGYVSIGEKEKVRPLELMQSLGVHVSKNSYTPKDILMAWSERMKKDGKVCIMKAIPFMVSVNGKECRLCTKKDEDFIGVSVQSLCPVVSATDKGTYSDVVVNVTNILRGLQQSVRVEETLAKLAKSIANCAALKEGYINIATKKGEEQYIPVVKNEDGTWSVKVLDKKAINKVPTNAKNEVKNSGSKKGTKGAKKVA